jgi:hypothetical protein
MRTRLGAALVAVLIMLLSSEAHAATRAYLMNGLLGWVFAPAAMPSLGARLRARGAIVTIGSWTQEGSFAADACRHRDDTIVFIGHSLGGPAATRAADAARACGVRNVRAVSIDPPRNGAVASRGVRSTNFVGVLGGEITGARNVPSPGYGHIQIANDPHMQARVVGAAIGR